MTKINSHRIILLAILLSFVAGFVCELMYHASEQKPVNIEQLRSQLAIKQQTAHQNLVKLKNTIIYSSVDSLYKFQFDDNDISYYLIKNGELIYWSANYTDLPDLPHDKSWTWNYFTSSNAHCISSFTTTNAGTLFAVIRIKNNYPFKNNQLVNKFANGIDVDENIDLVFGKKTDKWAVTDKWNNYLFTLVIPNQAILNQNIGLTGFIFQLLCFILMLVYFAGYSHFCTPKKLKLSQFLVIVSLTFLPLALALYYKFPHLLFYEVLSSAFDYSSGTLLASIIHLTLLTAYVLVCTYVFYKYVDLNSSARIIQRFILQLIAGLFFVLIFYILKGLVLHSGISINVLSLRDINIGVIWLHFLMLIWGISFAFLLLKTHNYSFKSGNLRTMLLTDIVVLAILATLSAIFEISDLSRISFFYIFLYTGFYVRYFIPRNTNTYLIASIWVLFFTLFIIENASMISKKKTENKYKVLAENILINGNADNDRVAEIMLGELNNDFKRDKQIGNLIQNNDSLELLNNYLTENYFRGFWNKYNIQLTASQPNSLLYGQNKNLISSSAVQLNNTNFYSFTSTLNEVAFMGVFPTLNANGDSTYLFLSFSPRKNFKSYSFPTFLMSSESDIQSRLNIATARYHANKLIYSGGNFKFPNESNFIPGHLHLFYKFTSNNINYYVYQPDKDNCVVITELHQHHFSNYLIYFTYTLLANLAIIVFFIWLFNRRNEQLFPKSSLSSKYQFAFVTLLIASFVGIFYVSVTFITSKYKEQQISEIDKKKNYIRNALQEKYYWTQDIATVSSQGLNFDLQELSYMYQTDINVYDNYGRLVGSSQSLIYNKNLMGRQIAPEPYFRKNSNINQEERIGELRFMTGYTDFYNGDYLQIGYISIPLYVSTEEIRNEIEDFLAVVVHIYLIIALLSVLLSFIIGKQLSAPLKMIESKLKKMRFGQRNEKIDYEVNDEIGQLVIQYNKTIAELEKSAQLLAQTERESAWRTMARQIAHEINNPLTPMKLTLQQLQRTKHLNDERFDEYFEKSTVTLVEQIDNLSRIAGTFSNFARMPEARFERMDVAAKLFSTTQLFVSNNEEIDISYSGDTQNVYVHADPEQMLQVFNNLLKNAIQAIPADKKGEIKVSLQCIDNKAIITISDNGNGIPLELQDKVFIPNFTTKSTGMGLGLYITKNIIELAGGTIHFTTNQNEGSQFEISLNREE
ncbi:MAG: ATP-binding protein [Paludibacter sp.]